MKPLLRVDSQTTTPQRRMVIGYAAAIIAVLITSAYPALTRLSVTTSLTPHILPPGQKAQSGFRSSIRCGLP